MPDPYLQSDGRTLRNRLGIVGDPAKLEREETDRVTLREVELRSHGFPEVQGFDLVKAIHRHLFQDVYDWAGQVRTTSLAKLHHEGASARTTFTPPGDIEQVGRAVFAAIKREQDLRGLSPAAFATRLAPYISELNVVHPFREGNGRTQRLVWEHMARQAGHDLAFEGISKERMIVASIAGEQGDLAPFRRMLEELLDPERRRALVTATRFLEQARSGGSTLDWNERYISTTTPGQRYAGVFVGADGRNFMLGSGSSIFVAVLSDLPDGATGLKPGDAISFQARQAPTAAQHRGDTGALERALAALAARHQTVDERPPTPIAGRQAKAEQPPDEAHPAGRSEMDASAAPRPRTSSRDPTP